MRIHPVSASFPWTVFGQFSFGNGYFGATRVQFYGR